MRPALVPLGVDDEYPAGAYNNVVDVGPSSGDPPIVKHSSGRSGQAVEQRTESLLADGARRPGTRCLRLVGHCEDQATQLWMVGADPLLPAGLASLELPPSRRTRRARYGGDCDLS